MPSSEPVVVKLTPTSTPVLITPCSHGFINGHVFEGEWCGSTMRALEPHEYEEKERSP